MAGLRPITALASGVAALALVACGPLPRPPYHEPAAATSTTQPPPPAAQAKPAATSR